MKKSLKGIMENESIIANLTNRGSYFNYEAELKSAELLKNIYGLKFLTCLLIESWKPNSLSYYFHDTGKAFLESEKSKSLYKPKKSVTVKLSSKKLGKDGEIEKKKTTYDFINYGYKKD